MKGEWFTQLSAGGAAGFALEMMARITLPCTVAVVVHLLLGQRRALARSAVWNAVLIGLIVMPVVTLACPRLRIECLASQTATSPDLQQTAHIPIPEPGSTPYEPPAGSVPSGTAAPSDSRVPRAETSPINFAAATLCVYVIGLLVLLARLGGSLGAVMKLKRSAVAVDDPAWVGALCSWQQRLNLGRKVDLVRSRDVSVPLAIGWFNPVIVLPEWPDATLSAPQIDAVLIHELAHLRRGDDVWNLIQQVVQVLYWPHPLTWVMRRLIASVREQACDDLCVYCGGGAQIYRSTLLVVAAGLVEQPGGGVIPEAPMALGLAMARFSTSSLRHRLASIACSPGASRCLLHWPIRAVITALALTFTTTLGAIELGRVAAAQSEPPQQKVKLAYDQPLPDSVRKSIVEVVVVDAASRAPIADAEVMVLNYVDLRFHTFSTDKRGLLRVVYPYSDKPALSLEVRKEGFVPQRSGWGFEKEKVDAPRQVTIALRSGVEVGGLVVDKAGRPIEGVTVVVSAEEYSPGDRLKHELGWEMLYEVPFRTGRDGRWRTGSCPPTATKIALQLIHSDYVSGGCATLAGPGLRHPSLEALRMQTDRQVMTKGVRVNGRVVDAAGKPIPGARICESSRGLTFLTYVRHAETDTGGRFHFHFEPDESVNLTVQVNGFEPATRSLTAKPDQDPIEFVLDAGKVIRGRVVDLGGKPIPGALVFIPGPAKHKGVFLRTWTDWEGRFIWGSAPSGQVELSISKEGYLWIAIESFTADDKETVVVLKPALTVMLSVRDAGTGRPIKSVSVETGTIDPATGSLRWQSEPAADSDDGVFRVTLDATKGPYQLRVKSKGFGWTASRTIRGDEKDVTEVIHLEKSKDQ